LNSSSLRSETDGFLHALGLKQVRDSEKETINRVEKIAEKRGYSMAQIATAWILSKKSKSV
jgi:aryl-alcohol dehydrogenase-like predicted oxidoreductase